MNKTSFKIFFTSILTSITLMMTPTQAIASSSASSATQISVVSGNGQTGVTGNSLAAAFKVKVSNIRNVGVGDVKVIWTVTSGGGALTEVQDQTDGEGFSSIILKLGVVAGSNSVTACVEGLSCVTFNATGVAPTPLPGEAEACDDNCPKKLQLFSGGLGGSGNADGTPARFNGILGFAVASNGTIYVADSLNHVIRKISPAGIVSTLAGTARVSGSTDGTGTAAKFYGPKSLALDSSGNLFVSDTRNNTIRKITPAGVVSTFAGTANAFVGGNADGTGAAARFFSPSGIVIDSSNNIFVADMENSRIRKITPSAVVTTFAGGGTVVGVVDGTGTNARFNNPENLTLGLSGNIYVSDLGNQTIRKITSAGVVTTLAGTIGVIGSNNGVGTAATFNYPRGIAADTSGNVYVADGNHTIRKITASGVVSTFAGTSGSAGNIDGNASAVRFVGPNALGRASNGTMYIGSGDTIRVLATNGSTTTLAGKGETTGSTDGAANLARYYLPQGLASDASGNIYVADRWNHTIRKITAAGVASTFAGTAGVQGSANGIGAAASFKQPAGIAVDSTGNVFVADSSNYTIRKITPSGVVSTFVGSPGQFGTADGTGSTARFRSLYQITIDGSNNLYVTDGSNKTIRKITPAGVVTTVAGLAGTAGIVNGTGSAALFKFPEGITAKSDGTLFVSDAGAIRKITPAGVVTTFVGTLGQYGNVDGTGSVARFNLVKGLAIDASGNIYAADYQNYKIRKITPSGVVSTYVGADEMKGVNLGCLPGSLNEVMGVAVNPSGQVFITTEHSVLNVY